MKRRLVVIESPYAGDIERNVAYALEAVRDCVARGESPYAGHLLLPRVLDDANPLERSLGIACHLAWIDVCDAVVVYEDHGITAGMRTAIEHAERICTPVIQFRRIGVPT